MKNLLRVQKAITMHMSGYTGKEIASKLEVTEKTVSNWLKDVKDINHVTHLIGLHRRFNTLVNDTKATTKEIFILNNVISRIEKKIETEKYNVVVID